MKNWPGVREFLELMSAATCAIAAVCVAAYILSKHGTQLSVLGWTVLAMAVVTAGAMLVLAMRSARALDNAADEASEPAREPTDTPAQAWLNLQLLRLEQAFEEAGPVRPNDRHPNAKIRQARRRRAAQIYRDEANQILKPYGGYVSGVHVIIKPEQADVEWTRSAEQDVRRRLNQINTEPILRGASDIDERPTRP